MKEIIEELVGSSAEGDDEELTVLERKYRGLVELSSEELDCLRALQSNDASFEPRSDLASDAEDHEHTHVILSGWGIRYKTLEDGRRQVLSFVLPGDIIGLYVCLSPVANSSVAAVTKLEASQLEPLTLLDVFGQHPRLGALLCWSASDDEAILREQVVRVGRRSALERTAHLLLEVQRRLQRVLPDRAEDRVFFPISQELLADTLGLSVVHINRVLRQLRQSELLHMEAKHFEILDWAGMCRAAKFDEDYLQQHSMPGATQAKLS